MRVYKRRGSRYYGRGHQKHKSGSKGGRGFAGSMAHNRLWCAKMRARIPVPKDKFIKFAKIIAKLEQFINMNYVYVKDSKTYILTHKFYKILEVPEDLGSYVLVGNNYANRS